MSNLIRKIILVICLIVFVGSAAYLAYYAIGTTGDSNALKELKGSASEEDYRADLLGLFEKNSDFRGWLTISGTKIDYPVMNGSDEDPEYYLHRDFNGDYSASGTPFLDENSVLESSNWLVYGHNMSMGTMFHDLLKFDEESFWREHPTFTYQYLDDSNEPHYDEFEIVAACYSEIRYEDSKEFKYYEYGYIDDEETFNEYVEGIMSESCYDTGLDAEFGDQLVTLSTCAYHTEDGRFYIVGVKKN